VVRSVIYLGAWITFAMLVLRGNGWRADADDPALKSRNVRRSAVFLVVFGITCWLSSYDWLMSLEPEWASTIYGVYNFAGLFVSGLAALIVLVIGFRATSGDTFSDDQLHDLGTLLFAFSSFWMYTWFCQYMLIWYVNKPEEAPYFILRAHGAWPQVVYLDLALNWGIPFLVLLFRSAKRSPMVLGTVAAIVLIGRFVDLWLMIVPTQSAEVPMPGIFELGPLVGAFGLFVLAALAVLNKSFLQAKTT
jgi:hypothetical protein